MKIKYRGHNGYDEKAASDQAVMSDELAAMPSMTVQSQAEDADINVMMRRYGITGKMPENPRIPSFGDFSGINDFRTALEAVRKGHEAFMEYPAELRARFDNDPQRWLEFCSSESNRDEMRKLGLLKELQPTPPVPPANTSATTGVATGTPKT